MLVQLEIQNIAIIDNISIELGKGLNILTGETGAGKSIIIDSINAILGERVSRDMIRTGADKGQIQAVLQVEFEKLADILENIGVEPEEDGTLIISREFSLSGRNTCRINGKLVTTSLLKEIGERIIDIHGQYDNQSLLKVENRIDLLDSFGGERIHELKKRYEKALTEYRTLKNRIRELSGGIGDRERKIDLLEYQIDEIKKSGLKIDEEDELNRKRDILVNSEKIANCLFRAYELLYSGTNTSASAADNISSALSEIDGIAGIAEKFRSVSEKLKDLSYQMEDVVEEIRKERELTESNPALLEKIEERLDLIYRLKRKYGSTLKEVLDYCDRVEKELEEIIKSEETVKSLNKDMENVEQELFALSDNIHKERLKAAGVLENKIIRELEDLEMKNSKFKVCIEYGNEADKSREIKFTKNGLDRVEFLISTNAGEPLKPLSRIASGGEMSRIMLAIKTILANVDKVPTLIFDEIDIGISGRVSHRIGEKLSYISRNHQVICVTHLAQIACMADNHYLIEKISLEESTATAVKMLRGDHIRNEIARLLGGATISEITVKHAEEMLKDALKLKNL